MQQLSRWSCQEKAYSSY